MAKLVKRGNGQYSVRYVVPPSLRPIIGKTQIWKSCHTSCKREAEERSHAILASIVQSVKVAKQQAARRPQAPDNKLLQNVIEQARELLTNPPTVGLSAEAMADLAKDGKLPFGVEYDDHTDDDFISIKFAEIIEQYIAARGFDVEDVPEDELRTLKGLSRMVTGDGTYMPLSEAIERHLTEKQGRINESTWLRKQRILYDFDTFAGNPDVTAIGRAEAGQFVSEVLLPSDVAVSTKKWRIGALSAAWNFFERKGFCKSNPWKGLTADVQGSTRGKPKLVKRAWTQPEIDHLKTLPESNVIKDVSIIRLHSGIRTEECCTLKITDIDLENATMEIGTVDDLVKTQSSVRTLWLHPVLIPILRRLVANVGPDGYLFKSMPRRGQDRKRGHNFSKVAGNWFRKNVTKDPRCTMYTLRHTYSQAMRNLGIDKDLIEWTTGHKDQSILFSTYAPEIAIERLREAVSRLDFGF